MENNVPESIKIEPVVEPKKEIDSIPSVVPTKEKRNGKDEKSRKKDDKSIEQILKSLSGCETPEEKLSALCRKYLEVVDENRKLQATLKQTDKKVLLIQREKDQLQSEKSKSVLTRSRLENLCRELQRQNKAVKEESLLKIREEEEKRKEVSAKFQSTLAEITALMAETNEKNVKLHEDNIEIHKKFKSVFDEMDIREQHFEGMHQMMKHELQVAEAKLNKVTLEMTEEKESLLKEKNQLLLKLTEYQTRIRDMQTVEANLRSQINMYTDKYDEFQTALTKSNEVFGGFNEEMEKMSKKILKLEKETSVWKLRWEKSHTALIDMAADKQTRDAEIATLNRKCSRLQALCKTFQVERSTLLAQLKEKSNQTDSNTDELANIADNQKLIESVENAVADPAVNGSNLLDKINAKIEETKEPKTETTCSITKSIEVNISNSDEENVNSNTGLPSEEKVNERIGENVSTKTVNSEDEKRLIENVPVKEESQPINNVIEVNKKEIPLECEKEEKIQQVPNQIQELIQTETVVCTDQSIEPLKVECQEETNDNVSNTPDIIKCTNKLAVNDNPEISEIRDAPKVESQVVNADKIVPNGEIHSNPTTNKKHKEGKKKRK